MAEGTKEDTWEGWLGGWVQAAKEKSTSAMEFIKKDLTEFTCTMQEQTERAVEKTSSVFKDSQSRENTVQHASSTVKASLTSFFDNISKALVIPPDDDDCIPMKVSADGTGLYDRGKARLHALQLDASTYMDPPRGSREQFSMWQESFSMDQHKGEISELLVSKVEVRSLYTKLVPSEVSHAEFWQRYFYRVHQLECDEARKKALMKRADQVKGDSISWDGSDDDWSGGEDDGNHSDWEKMPRPTQAQPTVTASTSIPISPQPELKHNSPDKNQAGQTNTSSLPETHTKAVAVKLKTDQINDQSKGNPPKSEEPLEETASAPSSSVLPSHTEINEKQSKSSSPSTAELEQMSASPEQVAGGQPDLPQANPWSLHIPDDTASASPEEPDSKFVLNVPSMELSSLSHSSSPDGQNDIVTEDNRQENLLELSACAAAGGDMLTISGKVDVANAGGACGAADMVSLVSDSRKVDAGFIVDIPAASVDTLISPQIKPGSELNVIHQAMPTDGCNAGAGGNTETASAVPKLTELSCSGEPSSSLAHESTVPSSAVSAEDRNDERPIVVPDQSATPLKSADVEDIGMRVKGDMVVVGDRGSPSSDSSESKELALEEEWEQDFDIEITEDDLKAAEDIAKKLGENINEEDDDWENWE